MTLTRITESARDSAGREIGYTFRFPDGNPRGMKRLNKTPAVNSFAAAREVTAQRVAAMKAWDHGGSTLTITKANRSCSNCFGRNGREPLSRNFQKGKSIQTTKAQPLT